MRLAQGGDKRASAEITRRFVNMAGKFAQKWRIPGMATEDVYATALIGIAQAIRKFDPSRGCKLSTLVHMCMLTEVHHARRLSGMSKRGPILDEAGVVSLDDGCVSVNLAVDHRDPAMIVMDNFSESEIMRLAFERCYTDRDRDVLRSILAGQSAKEVSEAFGLSKQAVHGIRRRVERRVMLTNGRD